jgi:hypothetical protein
VALPICLLPVNLGDRSRTCKYPHNAKNELVLVFDYRLFFVLDVISPKHFFANVEIRDRKFYENVGDLNVGDRDIGS